MPKEEVGDMISRILAQPRQVGGAGVPAEHEVREELINPKATVGFIESTVTEMDSRLTVSEGMEVRYKGSGADVPVSVLLPSDGGLGESVVVAVFRVTSALSVSGNVEVGRPAYTRGEIESSVREGLERLAPKA